MSDVRFSGQRGTTIQFSVEVTNPANGQAYDLTQAGVTAVVSFKRRRSDPVALITKTYRAGGPSDPGISVSGTDNLNIELAPGDTMPHLYTDGSFAEPEFLVWDVVVTEPGGQSTPVAKGGLTVRAGVST